MKNTSLYNAIIEDLQAIEAALNDSETLCTASFDDESPANNDFFFNPFIDNADNLNPLPNLYNLEF